MCIYVYNKKTIENKKVFEMNGNIIETVDAGPVTRWIEKYYEEKLDRRPQKTGGPSAGLLEQMFSLN